jgi:hypothetical protein
MDGTNLPNIQIKQELPEGVTYEDRNGKTVLDFYIYCRNNPQLRFWQALKNWSGFSHILSADYDPEIDEFTNQRDTYNLEGKDGTVAK